MSVNFYSDLNPVENYELCETVFPVSELPSGGVAPEMNFRELAPELNSSVSTSYLTHSLQKHPATFIPHIPSFLIRNTLSGGTGQTVLDCFSGRGTTGVEALYAGHEYVGVEINPLSHLLSRVATEPIPPSLGGWLVETVVEIVASGVSNRDSVVFPGRTEKEHWFEPVAVRGLEQVRSVVQSDSVVPSDVEALLTGEERELVARSDISVVELRERCRNLLVLSLADTVFQVSNADPGVSKAYKSAQMRDLIASGEHPPDVMDTFVETLEESVETVTRFWSELARKYTVIPESTVILGDSREFTLPEETTVNLAITSPPYINAINYYRGSKLRLFWIQDLLPEGSLSATELRKSIIGSNSSVSKSEVGETAPSMQAYWSASDDAYSETRLPELDQTLEQIFEGGSSTAEKKAVLTQQFFGVDMAATLGQVQEVLQDNGLFYFVVGNNVVEQQPVAINKYVESIATNLDSFTTTADSVHPYSHIESAFDTISHRELFQSRNHDGGVIECEWVIALQK